MFIRSLFTYFVSFLALLGPGLAANLYRLDFRSPAEARAAGGLVSRNPHGTGSVIDHVKNTLGNDDPWVSTTSDKKLAKNGATSPGNVYIYYINPAGLHIVDTVKEFKKAKQVHPHPGEKEFAVYGYIPWTSIIQWDTYKRGKIIATTTREEYEKSLGGGSPPRKGSPAVIAEI
ncbi:ADP-ribosylation [Xylaria palmicola]|nr:ADP-ribosylation [Xylaria palmicola]